MSEIQLGHKRIPTALFMANYGDKSHCMRLFGLSNTEYTQALHCLISSLMQQQQQQQQQQRQTQPQPQPQSPKQEVVQTQRDQQSTRLADRRFYVPEITPISHYSKAPPQQAAYPSQQSAYPSQQTPYPPQQVAYPSQQTAYPSQQTAYPSQQTAYPSQQVAYPPPQTAYPPQQTAYPPQQTQDAEMSHLAQAGPLGYQQYDDYPQQSVGHQAPVDYPLPMRNQTQSGDIVPVTGAATGPAARPGLDHRFSANPEQMDARLLSRRFDLVMQPVPGIGADRQSINARGHWQSSV